jgi:hypothetical protein
MLVNSSTNQTCWDSRLKNNNWKLLVPFLIIIYEVALHPDSSTGNLKWLLHLTSLVINDYSMLWVLQWNRTGVWSREIQIQLYHYLCDHKHSNGLNLSLSLFICKIGTKHLYPHVPMGIKWETFLRHFAQCLTLWITVIIIGLSCHTWEAIKYNVVSVRLP